MLKLLVLLFAWAIGAHLAFADDSTPKPTAAFPAYIETIVTAGADDEGRDAAVAAVAEALIQRRATIDRLIEVVDPKNKKTHSFSSRAAAACVLGGYRATEASNVLIRSLEDEHTVHFTMTYFESPFSDALRSIGEPAIPNMIDAIGQKECERFAFKIVLVLRRMLGNSSQRTIDLLTDALHTAKDPDVVKRYQSVIDDLRELNEREKAEIETAGNGTLGGTSQPSNNK